MELVGASVSFPSIEEKILKYWKDIDVFNRSMLPNTRFFAHSSFFSPSDGSLSPSISEIRPDYVFYDGPPFATGLPHYGHLLAGTIKDVVGRFFSMKGYRVDRRFGWDCHGVPVEFEVQKTLGLYGAKAIKSYGIDKFNEECRKIVLRYTREWRDFVARSGRWVDFDREYRTMDLHYMESIWWVVKSLWDRELIYEGLKCVPYSWAINTPLSNFEANLNYRVVQDPAIVVKFYVDADSHIESPLVDLLPADSQLVLYVWTTTPWTLPSNMALAVGDSIEYALVYDASTKEVAILAKNLLGRIFPNFEVDLGGNTEKVTEVDSSEKRILSYVSGRDLLNIRYEPLFPYFVSYKTVEAAFRVYSGDFVTEEDGTGVVHLASFGEEDLRVFLANGIPVIDPVDEDGNFTDAVYDFSARNVKSCDADIIKLLKSSGKLVDHKTLDHPYPFCWRTDTPLIYKSVPSWFIKVESLKDQLVYLNSTIHWVPEHLREGRMGKWLEGSKDWAISRNRFWGTPLPIWRCCACAKTECLGSIAELEMRGGVKVSDLHCHYVDSIHFSCAQCGGDMKRIPEVLDCWFESGAMPYAQTHYPFENKDSFEANFPADFIAEGLDQTRGWFYTLEVLSAALFGKVAFRNVVVNGIVLAEDGKKMSKSLKNYPSPDIIMGEFGADALRIYLLSSAATKAEELRFSKAGVRDVVRKHLLPLWNSYNFLLTYGVADGWSPALAPEEESSNILDRWVLSKVFSLAKKVEQSLSTYHLYAAAQPILDFVDQLTNWYIRLNRRRFWSDVPLAGDTSKLHAYATLHKVLVLFVRILAPVAPFVSEEIFLNLSKGIKSLEGCDSVHLTKFPGSEDFACCNGYKDLEEAMEVFQDVIELGRAIRADNNIRGRQPLASLTVIHSNLSLIDRARLLEVYIKEELNVKEVHFSQDEDSFVNLKAKLNTKKLGGVLGPKLGSVKMKELQSSVQVIPTEQVKSLERGETINICGVDLSSSDVLVERESKLAGGALKSSGRVTVALDLRISRELFLEGIAREFVNRIQKSRKDFGFCVSDRISVNFLTASDTIKEAVSLYSDYISREVLAVELAEAKGEIVSHSPVIKVDSQEIGGEVVIFGISVVV